MAEALEVIAGDRLWTVLEADALAILPELPDRSIDGLVTDPPYSSGGAFRGDRTKGTAEKYVPITREGQHADPDFEGDTRDQRGFVAWTSLWLAHTWRALNEGAPACLFSDWRQLPSVTDAVQAGGFVWRGIAPWDKTEAVRPTMGRFRAQAEFLVWGSRGPMPFDRGVGVLPGVFRASSREGGDKYHQTGKPVSMMLDAVAIVRPGGVILDPFAGSSSTGVAALRSGRRFIGIELSAYYAALSRERLEFEAQGLSLAAGRRQMGLF